MPDIHTSRLWKRILEHFQHMKACTSGKEYILAHKKPIGDNMLKACKVDHNEMNLLDCIFQKVQKKKEKKKRYALTYELLLR